MLFWLGGSIWDYLSILPELSITYTFERKKKRSVSIYLNKKNAKVLP
jgi:hypothetical protein